MAITAAIVASVVGSLGFGAYQASQAGGGTSRAPRYSIPPEAQYEKSLRQYTARLLAQGAASVPPSFLDFIASGEKATFNLGDTRMTPSEAVGLGITGRGGQPVPFVDPGQKQLTPEQIMFAAHKGQAGGITNPVLKLEAGQLQELQRLYDQLAKQQAGPQTKGIQSREVGEERRVSRLKGKLGQEQVLGY